MGLRDEPEAERDRYAAHGWRHVRWLVYYVPGEAGVQVVNLQVLEAAYVRVAGENEGLERE